MAEGKRGRHRAAPEADGVSLSAVADHFNANRKTVARWMREGLPHFRRGGRIFVDLERAAEWVAEHERDEADALPRAKVLHPTDPRYRERQARAALINLKGELASGQSIIATEAFQRHLDAVAGVFVRFGELMTHGADRDALADACESILADFTIDDPARWPVPLARVDEAESEPDPFAATEFEDESAVEYVPILADDDPRATVARSQAEKYERELAALQPNAIDLAAFLEFLERDCAEVRRSVRAMPARIVKRVQPGDDSLFVEAVIQYVADSVRFDYCQRHAIPCEWKPTPPQRFDDSDADSIDDVDGIAFDSEFEDLEGTQDDDDRYEDEDEDERVGTA